MRATSLRDILEVSSVFSGRGFSSFGGANFMDTIRNMYDLGRSKQKTSVYRYSGFCRHFSVNPFFHIGLIDRKREFLYFYKMYTFKNMLNGKVNVMFNKSERTGKSSGKIACMGLITASVLLNLFIHGIFSLASNILYTQQGKNPVENGE